jgi:hypothetical protein
MGKRQDVEIIRLPMAFARREASRKDRQRNVRQRNKSRDGLFPIPRPNISRPILSAAFLPPCSALDLVAAAALCLCVESVLHRYG